MNTQKITAFVITHNEEKNIEGCLGSISWSDEIVIVDSMSTDRTLDIAKKYTKNIYQKEFTNFSEMKNFALSKTTNDWVLSLDADEEVTDALRDEIKDKVQSASDNISGYFIHRKSYIFGREFKYTGTQNDFQMRLFKKEKGRFCQPIHEKVSIDGAVNRLKNYINHYTYTSLDDYAKRLNRYTDMEARFMKDKGCKLSILGMTVKPAAMFMRLYFLKQGFRDGIEGLLFSALSGMYIFLKNIKLWDLTRTGKEELR